MISRNDIFNYVKLQFETVPEYLWAKFPNYAVLRHKDTSKWYGVIMNVSKDKLGLCGNEIIDVLNVKCNPLLIGSLLKAKGYLPAYHMNKENWISIQLNSNIKKQDIFYLLNLSFEITNTKS